MNIHKHPQIRRRSTSSTSSNGSNASNTQPNVAYDRHTVEAIVARLREEGAFFCMWRNCQAARTVFKSGKLLWQHLCQQHLGSDPFQPGEYPCKWNDCQEKRHNLFCLKSHIKRHIDWRPYGCYYCHEWFKHKCDHKKHTQRRHASLPFIPPLELCGLPDGMIEEEPLQHAPPLPQISLNSTAAGMLATSSIPSPVASPHLLPNSLPDTVTSTPLATPEPSEKDDMPPLAKPLQEIYSTAEARPMSSLAQLPYTTHDVNELIYIRHLLQDMLNAELDQLAVYDFSSHILYLQEHQPALTAVIQELPSSALEKLKHVYSRLLSGIATCN